MAGKCEGWRDKHGNRHDCQFDEDSATYTSNNNNTPYCRFHFPMLGLGHGAKADWNDHQNKAISDAIIDRIKGELSEPENQSQPLDFSGVVVPGRLDFDKDATCSVDFHGAQFHGYVVFTSAEFRRDAWFEQAEFYKDTWFSKVQFHGVAGFNEAVFRASVEFSETRFHGEARFNELQFHGEARFNEAKFFKVAEFGKTLFYQYAGFNKAQFCGFAIFREVVFTGFASFEGAEFRSDAHFNNVRFSSFSWFRKAKFRESTEFCEAQFLSHAEFSEAQFHYTVLFTGSANTKLLGDRQFNFINFNKAHFGAGAIFSNREFLDYTNFIGCHFERAPKFHGSTLHQDTGFGGIECFPDVTSDGAFRAYRTLRQAMEGHRARAEEGMFYALEQKARRYQMKRINPAFWVSLVYEQGSNYGFSVVRPLVWLVVGIMASTVLLFCTGIFSGADSSCPNSTTKWGNALLFSVRQTFLLFDALRATDEILADYNFTPCGTSWLRVWGLVLSLFEGLSALLLILAVRWRYRR